MMAQFFKKWSAALVFALLLHLGVFFLFYMNSYENYTNVTDDSQKFTEDIIINTIMSEDDLLPIDKAQVSTLNTSKISAIIDNNQEGNLTTSKKSIAKTNETLPIMPLETRGTSPISSIKSETKSNEYLHKNNDKLDTKRAVNVASDSSPDKDLDNLINDVGLLTIDVPIRNSNVQIDRNYDLIRSELEKTNGQLSDAINEVKKRNQQKIDEIQRQNKNTYIQNSEITGFSNTNID